MKFRIRHVFMCASVMCSVVLVGCSGNDTTTPPPTDMQALPDLPFVEDMAERARCALDEHVQGSVCVTCPPGTSNAAGDHPDGPDTRCEERVCGIDEYVQNSMCVRCAPGTLNDPGDLLTGPDTQCEAVICRAHHHVQDNRCEPCPPGTTNEASDDASGPDTRCDVERCPEDYHVQAHFCVECPPGTRNVEGDNATGPDTHCDGILCPSDTHVSNHSCVACPTGTENEAGDDASGNDTQCDATLCNADEFVEDNACTLCPMDTVNEAHDDASGSDTSCEDACALVFGKPCNQVRTSLIKASNTDPDDLFGYSVAMSGNTLVVGATQEQGGDSSNPSDNSANLSGAVYVFERDPVADTWVQRAYLKASNSDAFDAFGSSVAISGDRIVVGARGEGSGSTNPDENLGYAHGAAYVFERDIMTGTWHEQAYLKASNTNPGDHFGFSVAISGDHIVVGAYERGSRDPNLPHGNLYINSGAAYVFEHDSLTDSWHEKAYLEPPYPSSFGHFGSSVAVSGDTVAIGMHGERSGDRSNPADDSADYSGAVYVFDRDLNTGTWHQSDYLKASNFEGYDRFGVSVAISSNTIVVGAANESSNSPTTPDNNLAHRSGAAYIFERDLNTNTWHEQAYLKASNLDVDDRFGSAVAISGDIVAVGAYAEKSMTRTNPADNTGYQSGAAYVFKRDPATGVWYERAYLKASSIDKDDSFGMSIAVSSTGAISVGTIGDDSATSTTSDNTSMNSGAVYVFD